MPNIAMRTAPATMSRVPRTSHGEKTSPKINMANAAFERSETAPNGARMRTGKEAIWKSDPRMFEERKIAKPSSQSLQYSVNI